MGFYPVEVLINDAKRHGVPVLPVDINASTYDTATEWVGRPGWAHRRRRRATTASHDEDPGEPLPDGAGIARRPPPVRSSACIDPVGRGSPAVGRRSPRPAMACAWGCGS